MYDKTLRPPKAGSLLEAVFLSVWLRRQEAELAKASILARGLASVAVASGGSAETLNESFQMLVSALFPFSKPIKESQDDRLREMVQKEAAKGPIQFTPNDVRRAFRKVATTVTMSDEDRARLAKVNRSERK